MAGYLNILQGLQKIERSRIVQLAGTYKGYLVQLSDYFMID